MRHLDCACGQLRQEVSFFRFNSVHPMMHSFRSLSLILFSAFVVPAVFAETPAIPTQTHQGLHVTARFRPDDWKLLKDPKEYMGFLDQTYEAMAELTGYQPPMELRGYEKLGAWGTAGLDGINIDWTCVPRFMNDFNTGKIEFGFVHEMGHVFDARNFPRWYITPNCGGETFGNIKLSYALERLLLQENRYRIEFGPGGLQTGYDFNNHFYLMAGRKYLASNTAWDKMGVDDLHSFHMTLIRKLGWDVYKKWFRSYYQIESQKDGRAPAGVNDPLRINLVCALLSIFSEENLVPDFQQWRFPVSDESVINVSKRYDLKTVCAATDKQYDQEYRAGKIRLDPLGLQVRVKPDADGNDQATIFCILRSNPDVVVRYSMNNTPVTSTSKVDSGTPIPLPAGKILNAAAYVVGKPQPVLTTHTTLDPKPKP